MHIWVSGYKEVLPFFLWSYYQANRKKCNMIKELSKNSLLFAILGNVKVLHSNSLTFLIFFHYYIGHFLRNTWFKMCFFWFAIKSNCELSKKFKCCCVSPEEGVTDVIVTWLSSDLYHVHCINCHKITQILDILMRNSIHFSTKIAISTYK